MKFKKFSKDELMLKLADKGWRGKSFSFNNKVTYISYDNKTIAEVTYDESKQLVLSVRFN